MAKTKKPLLFKEGDIVIPAKKVPKSGLRYVVIEVPATANGSYRLRRDGGEREIKLRQAHLMSIEQWEFVQATRGISG